MTRKITVNDDNSEIVIRNLKTIYRKKSIEQLVIKIFEKRKKKKEKLIEKIKKLQEKINDLNKDLIFPSDISRKYKMSWSKTYDIVQKLIMTGKIINNLKLDDTEPNLKLPEPEDIE